MASPLTQDIKPAHRADGAFRNFDPSRRPRQHTAGRPVQITRFEDGRGDAQPEFLGAGNPDLRPVID
jgi:hypothetical protein